MIRLRFFSLIVCLAALILLAVDDFPAAGEDVRNGRIETLPAARGGQDLVGTALPEMRFARWLNTPEGKPLDTANTVTLYRWWTDTCPFCAATLPAIERIGHKYGQRGLRIVAVYHPKPPRPVTDETVNMAAKRIGYSGSIAIDEDWAQLRHAWLTPGRRAATSVTLLVDRKGIIRFVHPGVEFFPSDKPDEAVENHDFELIDRAIAALLNEKDEQVSKTRAEPH